MHLSTILLASTLALLQQTTPTLSIPACQMTPGGPACSVTTPSGPIIGFYEATNTGFLGIPFANPPVRFSNPEPVTPWVSPLMAVSFPPACAQDPIFGAQLIYQSEDCLHLNVFTPLNMNPGDQLSIITNQKKRTTNHRRTQLVTLLFFLIKKRIKPQPPFFLRKEIMLCLVNSQ